MTWAENKYKFYKLLGNKLKLDMPITYKSIKDNICGEIEELAKEYPGICTLVRPIFNFKKLIK